MDHGEPSSESSPLSLLQRLFCERSQRLGCLWKCKNRSIKRAAWTHRSPPEFIRNVRRNPSQAQRQNAHGWVYQRENRSATSDQSKDLENLFEGLKMKDFVKRCGKQSRVKQGEKKKKPKLHKIGFHIRTEKANIPLISILYLLAFFYLPSGGSGDLQAYTRINPRFPKPSFRLPLTKKNLS